MIADVNDDGLPDRVADPSGIGAGPTITFGAGAAHETTSRPRDLADHAGEHQTHGRAARRTSTGTPTSRPAPTSATA